jgi:hypothetical protein
MSKVFRPKEAISTRHISTSEEERKLIHEEHRERRKNQDKIKTERFAKIEENRKKKRDGQGRGINIEVTGDKD